MAIFLISSLQFQLYIEIIYDICEILFHPQMHNTHHNLKYFVIEKCCNPKLWWMKKINIFNNKKMQQFQIIINENYWFLERKKKLKSQTLKIHHIYIDEHNGGNDV